MDCLMLSLPTEDPLISWPWLLCREHDQIVNIGTQAKDSYLIASPLMFEKDRDFLANNWVCTNPDVIWVLSCLMVLILHPECFVIFDMPRVHILSSLAFRHLFLQSKSVEMSGMLNFGERLQGSLGGN